MARRALRLAQGGLALLALGLGYAVFCFLTKWALPCQKNWLLKAITIVRPSNRRLPPRAHPHRIYRQIK